ncbi:MAG: acylneuraminate cytidylyltransferase family protein [Synergistaceae bacterium]|nr:acylneuraminate cytidylyltransferase family protein [Synergistaceae bacterium]
MFNEEKILALIPARGGSKGIKGKNITPLAGRPLIAYTIEAALNSKYIDKVIVSTDNQEIANTAKKFGAEVPFMRPPELADDKAKTIDAVLHALRELNQDGKSYDVLILLQPTSPLRNTEDIDNAIETFFDNGKKGLVSISPVEDSPVLIRSLDSQGKMSRLLNLNSTCRRQDMPEYFRVNGSIYINNVSEINISTSFNDNPIPFIMTREHSLDIDEPKDLILAEYYINA